MTEEQAGFSPREVVSGGYIIGQEKAKRAVAVALRNRWRRRRLPESLREEVYPKNIERSTGWKNGDCASFGEAFPSTFREGRG